MGQGGHDKSRGLYILSMKKETKFINCEKNIYTPQNSVSS